MSGNFLPSVATCVSKIHSFKVWKIADFEDDHFESFLMKGTHQDLYKACEMLNHFVSYLRASY